MTVVDIFRYWFAAAFILGLAVFVTAIIAFRRRDPRVEKAIGKLPPPPALMTWLIPPIILLIGVGSLSERWIVVRLVGVALSVYALFMMVWATSVLGRNYAPGMAILEGQRIITSGPYRLVRHPIYSAVIALWIGGVIGALNWLLLLFLPMVLIGVTKQAAKEEELLRERFGAAYEEYAVDRPGLVPGLTRSREAGT